MGREQDAESVAARGNRTTVTAGRVLLQTSDAASICAIY